MKKVLLGITLILGFVSISQEDAPDHVHHDHHSNEIGVALAPVYFVKEKELSFGLHLHYLYNFPHTKWGIGLGYEHIFDDHKHNTFGIVGSYRPIDGWSINLSPGVTFEGSNYDMNFALHAETAYEFELGNFHVGPAFEFAYDPEDYHVSLGLHLGYGF